MARLRSSSTRDSQDAVNASTFSVGTSAPTGPTVGQRWYKSDTGVTYQYTNDGTSSFWLDISSGGIGRSASRSVDYVGDTDPVATTNGAGLAAGKIYYNRESNNYFRCLDPANNANVWASEFIPVGGRIYEYRSGTDRYRSHSFYKSGIFYADSAMTAVDILVVGGGGGSGTGRAGGGGGGGLVTHTNQSIAAGSHTVTIGAGGALNGDGGDSQFGSLTAAGGGGAGADGVSAANTNGGDGGAGVVNAYQTGANQTYSRGGHGGQSGVTWGDPAGSLRSFGDSNTFRDSPIGEGGSSDDSTGHTGYQGIVIIRYPI